MTNVATLGIPESTVKPAAFDPGDVVRVSVRIKEGDKERVQVFQGTVIQKRGTGAGATFTVRKMSAGIGVERIFPLYSPNIAKVELVKQGKVKRAKLYYVRGLTGRSSKVKERKVESEKAEAAASAE